MAGAWRHRRPDPSHLHGSKVRFALDSPLEGTGFEPSVPPSKRRPWSGGPRPTTVVWRDELCLMTPSSLSVRYLRSATAKRPFRKSGTDGSNPVPLTTPTPLYSYFFCGL